MGRDPAEITTKEMVVHFYNEKGGATRAAACSNGSCSLLSIFLISASISNFRDTVGPKEQTCCMFLLIFFLLFHIVSVN